MDDGFKSVLDHVNFLAKKLFGQCGEIINGSVARLSAKGGGPVHEHTHEHSHLFIVVSGEARVKTNGEEKIIRENEALLVDGNTPHSVWNNLDTETVMIGISVK